MTGGELYKLLGGELWLQLVLMPNLPRPRERAMRNTTIRALLEGAETLARMREAVHEACRKGELVAWHGQHELVFEQCTKALDRMVEAYREREFEWSGTHFKPTD